MESVVVTETWFFRDREPFGALVRLVLEEWLPSHPAEPVRLLSLPCSSGEEPYSLVMALLEAGVPPERFRIDAVDISPTSWPAPSGASMAGTRFAAKTSVSEAVFSADQRGFVLNPAIRSCVYFSHGNLLSEDFLAGKGPMISSFAATCYLF